MLAAAQGHYLAAKRAVLVERFLTIQGKRMQPENWLSGGSVKKPNTPLTCRLVLCVERRRIVCG